MPAQVKHQQTTSDDLVTAFNEMQVSLNAANRVLSSAYSELEIVHKGAAGMKYREGLDEISGGLSKVQNALETLRSGIHGRTQINSATEQANTSSAAQVGLAAGAIVPSWT
ncbi:hypothetical protein AB0F59_32195 [Micromonospora lupini]|uniref:hypothetical protein n=1 Tax=Micromonospora lupini TaxID=285679 RepID=UPI00340A62A6